MSERTTDLNVVIRTRVDESTAQELERIARLEDRSVAAVTRRAVRYYIDSRRKGLV
jgi:predicted transcriptional regulator